MNQIKKNFFSILEKDVRQLEGHKDPNNRESYYNNIQQYPGTATANFGAHSATATANFGAHPHYNNNRDRFRQSFSSWDRLQGNKNTLTL